MSIYGEASDILYLINCVKIFKFNKSESSVETG